jgi:hypothetical protein
MAAFEYEIQHYYQPTNNSCSQSSLAMLLSYYGKQFTPEDIMEIIPVRLRDDGTPWGTINQNLATWCLGEGFDVDLYSADIEIIDLSWMGLEKDEVIKRLEETKKTRDVPIYGPEISRFYIDSYIDFLNSGGRLHIEPYMTTKLLDECLAKGPILACTESNILHSSGRSVHPELRTGVEDAVNGILANHSIVIVGKDDEGRYKYMDPWVSPGSKTIEPEHLLAAMASSVIECDNLFFQLSKKD